VGRARHLGLFASALGGSHRVFEVDGSTDWVPPFCISERCSYIRHWDFVIDSSFELLNSSLLSQDGLQPMLEALKGQNGLVAHPGQRPE